MPKTNGRGADSDPAGVGSMFSVHFQPAPWLRNPHLQTIYPKLFRPRPRLSLCPERVELPDGDFIDLSWTTGQGPRVLLLPGLGGDLRSHYALPLMASLLAAGFHPVFMYPRGTSGTPNRLPCTHHAGACDDLAGVLEYLHVQGRPIDAAIGVSLGGNVLLRYLGLAGRSARLRAAVAVSVPFMLDRASRYLERSAARIYKAYLLRRLRHAYRAKSAKGTGPVPPPVELDRIRTLWDYDQQITAPLNGFADADDYYRRSSCFPVLGGITTPTLILHSIDDPFLPPDALPRPDQVGPGVHLALLSFGGHLGFVERLVHGKKGWLLDRAATTFLQSQLPETASSP
ncbi:MAG: YheT family hydrolase [Desulfobulbus sp.]|jgi:predicted alpha/beta-fold hydrolase